MELKPLTVLLRARWEELKAAARKDSGQSTGELAVMAAVLIVVAASVAAAIKFKVAEKIGIINGQ